MQVCTVIKMLLGHIFGPPLAMAFSIVLPAFLTLKIHPPYSCSGSRQPAQSSPQLRDHRLPGAIELRGAAMVGQLGTLTGWRCMPCAKVS